MHLYHSAHAHINSAVHNTYPTAASARSTSMRLSSFLSCALQVSKGLLDTAMKAPQRPQRPTISSQAVSGPEEIAGLLTFREQMLTAEIGLAMTRASKGAGSGQSRRSLDESECTAHRTLFSSLSAACEGLA